MPVNWKLLAQDPDQKRRYESSLALRCYSPPPPAAAAAAAADGGNEGNSDDDGNAHRITSSQQHLMLLLSNVLALRQEALDVWKERDALVADLRELNKGGRQRGGDVDADVQSKRMQQHARKQRIQQLTKQHQLLQQQLETVQNQLPNFVDTAELINETTSEQLNNTAASDRTMSPDMIHPTTTQPVNDELLLELGGYEEFGGVGDSSRSGIVVLTEVGMKLLDKLGRFVQRTCLQKLNTIIGDGDDEGSMAPRQVAVHSWEVPSTMVMDSSDVEAMLGCCCFSHNYNSNDNTSNIAPSSPDQDTNQSSNNNKSPSTTPLSMAPSWIALLRQQHGGKSYYDRQLPIFHLLKCTTNNNETSDKDDTSHYTTASREIWRRATWQQHLNTNNNKQQKSPCWYQRLATPQICWQLLALTGPCLEADSRPLQQELIAEFLVDMYRQLVVIANCNDHADNEHIVRARTLPPHELLPSEASCVVVEGLMPASSSSASSASSSPSYACLGFISNVLDYASNLNGVKHGSTKEGLHVLHGTICSVPETMTWILCHCGRSSSSTSSFVAATTNKTVLSPPSLAVPTHAVLPKCLFELHPDDLSSRSSLLPPSNRLPLIRRVVMKRNGKRTVQAIPQHQQVLPPPELSDAARQKNQMPAATKRAGGDADDNNKKPALKVIAGASPQGTTLTQPTPEEILLEATSCPFDFLPFYSY